MSDDRDAHVRALVVTTVASLAGVVAAVAADVITADIAEAAVAAQSRNAQLTVLAAVVLQLPAYELAFDEWGGAKDVLYVAFMTFIMWFVAFGVILTTGAQLV